MTSDSGLLPGTAGGEFFLKVTSPLRGAPSGAAAVIITEGQSGNNLRMYLKTTISCKISCHFFSFSTFFYIASRVKRNGNGKPFIRV